MQMGCIDANMQHGVSCEHDMETKQGASDAHGKYLGDSPIEGVIWE